MNNNYFVNVGQVLSSDEIRIELAQLVAMYQVCKNKENSAMMQDIRKIAVKHIAYFITHYYQDEWIKDQCVNIADTIVRDFIPDYEKCIS